MKGELPLDLEERMKRLSSRVKSSGKREKPLKERAVSRKGKGRKLSRTEALAQLEYKTEQNGVIKINPEQIYELALDGATYEEIGRKFGVGASTICRRITRNEGLLRAYESGKADLSISLKRAVIKSAIEKGHPISQIWATKNLCGWKDRPEDTSGGDEKKRSIPDWMEKALKEGGSINHSEVSLSSTVISNQDTKDFPGR